MTQLYQYLASNGWSRDDPNAWRLRLPPVPFDGDAAARQKLFQDFVVALRALGWNLFSYALDVTGELSVSLGPQHGAMLSLSSHTTDDLDTVLVLEVTDLS